VVAMNNEHWKRDIQIFVLPVHDHLLHIGKPSQRLH
jgi:hypothetical protein